MNLVQFAFVDPSMFGATLLLKYHRHFADDTRRQDQPGSPHHDTECIVLRGPEKASADNWQLDVPHVDSPLLSEWVAARQFIANVESAIHQHLAAPNLQLGKIMVASLNPGGTIDWHIDQGPYAEQHHRFHICVLPNAGSWLYSGGEAIMAGVGNLTYFNNRILHSAANFGAVPRVHLICDVRKPTMQ